MNGKEKRIYHIRKIFKKICESKGVASEIVFSIGLGSLLACYLILVYRIKLIPLSSEVDNIFNSGNISLLDIGEWDFLIFTVGFWSILIAPFLSRWTKGMVIKISLLLVLIVINVVGIISIVAQGEIISFVKFIIWVSSVYIVWFIIGIFKIIYDWLKIDDKENEQFNIVKLTLIWGTISFLLVKMFK